MKKYILLIFLAFSILASCTNSTGAKTNESESSEQDVSDSLDDNKTCLFLQNESQFKVTVYNDSLRENALFTINPNDIKQVPNDYLTENTEAIFYITYFVDVGLEIPWSANDSFVIASVQYGKSQTAIIHTPNSMPTSNCYVVLENNTDEELVFKQGKGELYVNNENETTILEAGKKTVYEIKSVYFENLPSFYISTVKGEIINLPQSINKFESGNIYSIIVSYQASKLTSALKAITPFNLDTTKQIWSFSDKTFLPETAVMRECNNISDGFFIMGTLNNNQSEIGLKKIDRYNSGNTLNTVAISHDNSMTLEKSRVIDFAEMNDGSMAILLQNDYKNGNDNQIAQLLVCYDFSSKSLKWSYIFPDRMIFRTDSKNVIISTSDGKVAVVGAVVKKDKNDCFCMHRYISVFYNDGSGKTNISTYISKDYTNLSDGVETIFSSAWYDGKDFYACGYDNCDFNYTQERKHKGIIWKFSSDLSSKEMIYECENALFFSLDGINEKWYACGEYCDTGMILKGCYISSEILEDNKTIIKYTLVNYPYCAFSQLFCYEDKIILAGKASKDFAGIDSPLPIILAYDLNSNILIWENTNLINYTSIQGIIPNAIGTYIVQLCKDSKLCYISADLLGK